ncbi:hypothetical protein EJ110_NYTH54022 [Nymphaea thermarum]|nr:hypothetical protein EJ110_NYTH54022 [Nymphaea thermarum]
MDGELSVEKVLQIIITNCRSWRGEGMKELDGQATYSGLKALDLQKEVGILDYTYNACIMHSCSHCVTTRTNLRSVAITDKGVYCRNVMNELENAKTEYLHASIEVTIKKRVVLPKLLYWYMQDFADDLESLLEWIYSQLPRTTSLRKSIMDCLKGERKWPIQKMVEL